MVNLSDIISTSLYMTLMGENRVTLQNTAKSVLTLLLDIVGHEEDI